MTNTKILSLAQESNKGGSVRGLAENVLEREVAFLRLSGAVVDQETFTLGSEVYEIHVINTDTTINVSNGQLNDVLDRPRAVDMLAHGLLVGAILRVEAEFLLVEAILSPNAVKLSRGYAGSTIATHADATSIFKAAQVIAATSQFAVPTGATLTAAAADDLIIAAVNKFNTLGITAVVAASGRVLLSRAPSQVLVNAEVLSNGTIDAAFRGGSERGESAFCVTHRSVTAEEATDALIEFDFKFIPVAAHAIVMGKAWDGAVAIVGNRVTLDNGGVVDWVAADIVMVFASGA